MNMKRGQACKEIIDLFIRIVNKYNSLEKYPAKFGAKHALYHSERHMIDRIGESPGMNVTELAKASGVTKGAISQVITKLQRKGVVRRSKRSDNDKEVLIELTNAGKTFHQEHQTVHHESTRLLLEELKKYPDDKIVFLIEMFRWFDGFLDLSREKMAAHATRGH